MTTKFLLASVAKHTQGQALTAHKNRLLNRVSRTAGLLGLLVLAACGGGSGGGDSPDDTVDVNTNSGTVTANSSEDCAFVLSSDITSPTRLVNTSSDCDYLLTRWVEVRSLLEIEPGTVIRSEADEQLIVEGGEVLAVGTPDQRIVFEGLVNVQGFWKGIDVRSARSITMDYVDIRDAGQICNTIFCPDVGVQIGDTVLSFTNSSVSNSYVHGMSIYDDTEIAAFGNNRFFGNGLGGLNMDIELVPEIDAGSDYFGIGDPNGQASVGIISGEQGSGRLFQWKAINAPYYVGGYMNILGGVLELQPGVTLQFGEEAWMTVEGNGVFKSLGTVEDPILIVGSEQQLGWWEGITMEDLNFTTSVLQNTIIAHSGNTEGLLSSLAGVRLSEGTLTLRNTTFQNNSRWGIFCTEPDFHDEPSILIDGGGNMFNNNTSGDVSSNCTVQ